MIVLEVSTGNLSEVPERPAPCIPQANSPALPLGSLLRGFERNSMAPTTLLTPSLQRPPVSPPVGIREACPRLNGARGSLPSGLPEGDERGAKSRQSRV
jgi:hypothetical protein